MIEALGYVITCIFLVVWGWHIDGWWGAVGMFAFLTFMCAITEKY